MNKVKIFILSLLFGCLTFFSQTSSKGASILFLDPTLNNCVRADIEWLIDAEKKIPGNYWYALDSKNNFMYTSTLMNNVQKNWNKTDIDQRTRNQLRKLGIKYIVYQSVAENNGFYNVVFTIVDTANFKKPIVIGTYSGNDKRFGFWFHNSIKKYVMDCNAASNKKFPVYINPFDQIASSIEYQLEDSLLVCTYKNNRVTDNFFLIHGKNPQNPHLQVVSCAVRPDNNCQILLNGIDIKSNIKMGTEIGGAVKKAAIEISKRLQ